MSLSAASFSLVAGLVCAFLSVAFGAFGAHALKARISVEYLAVFQTGVHYQMFHALALVLFSLWADREPAPHVDPAFCFALGIFLFSGSLYALALTQIRVLGAITPLGGILFLAGWLLWIKAALKP